MIAVIGGEVRLHWCHVKEVINNMRLVQSSFGNYCRLSGRFRTNGFGLWLGIFRKLGSAWASLLFAPWVGCVGSSAVNTTSIQNRKYYSIALEALTLSRSTDRQLLAYLHGMHVIITRPSFSYHIRTTFLGFILILFKFLKTFLLQCPLFANPTMVTDYWFRHDKCESVPCWLWSR